MTSSSAVPYRMPDAASVPDGGTTWKINPHRSALLVQHMQKHVLRTLRETAPVGELLANIGRLVHCARASDIPVLYVTRAPGQRLDGTDRPGPATLMAAPPGPLADGDARAFAEVLQPQPGDTVLTAKRYNAFAGTRLRSRLTELGRDQLVVVGAAARTDVLLTAADAWMQDLQPVVVADAVADRTADAHAMAVDWLAATCSMVTVTDSAADAFRGRSAAAVAV
ncbi:isochorismatase family protein [Streptomyces sp. LP11]|uniref:Isochorismatase family protein n=1 Tax=Streptomyces pyxinicus TaxID=2970331 RepID=A0ABT2BAN9_9ACTN|nr:isochorismatase family protein [Streptomyces sp. LP11]MCS0605554.1 isochorismatase family protein [Streptomyces sp. LP11]